MEPPPAEPVVELRGVGKQFDRAPRGSKLRSAVPFLAERLRDPFAALDHVDLDVRPGEALGLIGPNGAGKSTILKVMAGVTSPTTGTVRITGTVGPMIELGLGFHPDLTGWQNARCSMVMQGHPLASIDSLLPLVDDFAGLGEAMDRPVRTYSAGMNARLAFAVATHSFVDVLLVDEVLAVGDQDFQMRCMERIQSLLADGTALVFVSHEMALVTGVCSRVVQIREGRVVDQGAPEAVVERYLSRSGTRLPTMAEPSMRVRSFSIPSELSPTDPLRIDAEVEVLRPVERPALGVELTLPTLFPDDPVAACLDRVPTLREPGTYRLRGESFPLGGENAKLRLTLSLVEDLWRNVSDQVSADSSFVRPGTGMGAPSPVGGMLHLETAFGSEPPIPLESPADGAHRRRRPAAEGPPLLSVHHLTKWFQRSRRPDVDAGTVTRHDRRVVALDDVSLQIAAGEAVGLIGPNGAGKTTLLRALAGITQAQEGRIDLAGRVVPMIDLGAGFHGELGARDNLRVNGRLLGLPRDLTDEELTEVIRFAGVEDAVDLPCKHYSSGMLARLGFASAMAAPGDILLVDELLAVGDDDFRKKAVERLRRRRSEGAAVVFVSHELNLVEQVCDRVVLLRSGRVVDDGPANDVIAGYAGRSWAGGVRDATAGIRVLPITLRERHIESGGTLHLEGTFVVDQPCPTARLELAYRAVPEDRSIAMGPAERAAMSIYHKTVVPAHSLLDQPGVHHFHATVEGNQFGGQVDVVVSAIDEHDGEVLSESWQELLVGRPRPEGFPGPVLDFTWTAERVDER